MMQVILNTESMESITVHRVEPSKKIMFGINEVGGDNGAEVMFTTIEARLLGIQLIELANHIEHHQEESFG